MKRFLLLALCLLSAAAFAQQPHQALTNALEVFFNTDTPASTNDYAYYIGVTGTNVSALPQVSGISVVAGWASYDIGTSSIGPRLSGSAMNTLDSHLCAAAGGTYNNSNTTGASCTGTTQTISIRWGNMKGSSPNSFTPTYTFAPAWTANKLCTLNGIPCSHDQSFCACAAYQGAATNVGQCGTLAGGMDDTAAPSVWEPTHVSAYIGFLKQMVQYYSAAGWTDPNNSTTYKSGLTSLIGYIDIGTGGSGQATLYCYTLQSTGNGGYPAPLLTESVWSLPTNPTNYHSTVYNAVKTQMINSGVTWLGTGSSGNGSGTGTPPTVWQDDTATDASLAGFGSGSQSLSASQPYGNITGDTYLYAWGETCAADWCNWITTLLSTFPRYRGLPATIFQTLSPTNPNAVQQNANYNNAGALQEILPFASSHGVHAVEIAMADWVCTWNTTLPTDGTVGSTQATQAGFIGNCPIAQGSGSGYNSQCGGSQSACQQAAQNAMNNFLNYSPATSTGASGTAGLTGTAGVK
jgi:hypothetical protein